MSRTLYICGNGFDLHHGLGTAYRNYRCYIKINAPDLIDWFKERGYLDIPELWNDLETNLDIDFQNAFSDIYDENPVNSFEDGDKKWENLRYAVLNELEHLKEFTTTMFLSWIKTIDLSIAEDFKDIDLATDASFVTFNYTSTLERVYGIDNSKILHIHGSVSEVNEAKIHDCIQFGNDKIIEHEKLEQYEKIYGHVDFYDVMVEDAVQEMIEIAHTFSKDIRANFAPLREFVEAQGNFSEVVVMGHCLKGIDLPYYTEVLVPILKDCLWKIKFHTKKDKENALKFAQEHELRVVLEEW